LPTLPTCVFFVLVHRPDDIIAERLASSFSDDELPKRNDEYEFINLPSVPLPERIPPLSETRWTSLFTTYGRIIDSDTVEEEIFRGVSIRDLVPYNLFKLIIPIFFVWKQFS